MIVVIILNSSKYLQKFDDYAMCKNGIREFANREFEMKTHIRHIRIIGYSSFRSSLRGGLSCVLGECVI